MQIAYMLETANGDSLADQRTALQSAGVPIIEGHDPVYVDRMPKGRRKRRLAEDLEARLAMVKAVRSGDVICVAGLERLGVSEDDITAALKDITSLGASVLDVKTGKTYRFEPALVELYQAIRAAGVALLSERTRPGRTSARAMGLMGGRTPRLVGQAKAAAKADWEVAARHGVSVKTMYNTFGPRGDAVQRAPAKRRSKL